MDLGRGAVPRRMWSWSTGHWRLDRGLGDLVVGQNHAEPPKRAESSNGNGDEILKPCD